MKKANLDQILKALAKVPPLKREKTRERDRITKSGKETELKPLLKALKIREINEWVKKTLIAIDNLIFELFPKATRKIPHLNTHIRYEKGEVSLLCLGVRQSKIWVYVKENEVSRSWSRSHDGNLIREGFTRKLEIPAGQVYRDNPPLIKESLNL